MPILCTICNAEAWWRYRHDAEDTTLTLDQSVMRDVKLSTKNLPGFVPASPNACREHEVELAARLLRLEGVA